MSLSIARDPAAVLGKLTVKLLEVLCTRIDARIIGKKKTALLSALVVEPLLGRIDWTFVDTLLSSNSKKRSAVTNVPAEQDKPPVASTSNPVLAPLEKVCGKKRSAESEGVRNKDETLPVNIQGALQGLTVDSLQSLVMMLGMILPKKSKMYLIGAIMAKIPIPESGRVVANWLSDNREVKAKRRTGTSGLLTQRKKIGSGMLLTSCSSSLAVPSTTSLGEISSTVIQFIQEARVGIHENDLEVRFVESLGTFVDQQCGFVFSGRDCKTVCGRLMHGRIVALTGDEMELVRLNGLDCCPPANLDVLTQHAARFAAENAALLSSSKELRISTSKGSNKKHDADSLDPNIDGYDNLENSHDGSSICLEDNDHIEDEEDDEDDDLVIADDDDVPDEEDDHMLVVSDND